MEIAAKPARAEKRGLCRGIVFPLLAVAIALSSAFIVPHHAQASVR